MKLPRNLSGAEVVEGLVRSLGYRVVHQRGSHVESLRVGKKHCNSDPARRWIDGRRRILNDNIDAVSVHSSEAEVVDQNGNGDQA